MPDFSYNTHDPNAAIHPITDEVSEFVFVNIFIYKH